MPDEKKLNIPPKATPAPVPTAATAATEATVAEKQENYVAGFNFNLYELQELYANIRDGNYWTALCRAVEILDKVINPRVTVASTGTIAQRQQAPVKMSELMEIERRLEETAKHLAAEQKDTMGSGSVRASSEKNVKSVDLMGLLALVNMIVGMLKQFRESK